MRTFLPSLLAACAAGLGALPAAAEEQDVFEFRLATPPAVAQPIFAAQPRDVLFLVDAEAASQYWLGVTLRPADDTLKSQLGVKQGVVVDHVAPDSPASKAGLAQHDLLVKFAGHEIAGVNELIKAVDERKDKEADLEIIRGGKRETMKITAAKRPEHPAFAKIREIEAQLPAGAKKWVERLGGEPGEGPIRFQFAHPGVIVGHAKLAEMPKDLKVKMLKEGDGPLKITVEQGDKKWELTEKELDKLPAELRPHVEAMLPGAPGGGFKIFQRAVPAQNLHPIPGVPAVPGVQVVPAPHAIRVPGPNLPGGPARIEVRAFHGDELEKRLEKKIEELQKRVEELEKRAK